VFPCVEIDNPVAGQHSSKRDVPEDMG